MLENILACQESVKKRKINEVSNHLSLAFLHSRKLYLFEKVVDKSFICLFLSEYQKILRAMRISQLCA